MKIFTSPPGDAKPRVLVALDAKELDTLAVGFALDLTPVLVTLGIENRAFILWPDKEEKIDEYVARVAEAAAADADRS